MNLKIVISIISVILVFVAYGPYIWNILKRKTIPHTFTFLIWGILSSITYALQIHGGAGIGAWVTLSASFVCVLIFFLSLKYGEKSISILDVIFLILAIISLFLWLVIDQPIVSIILVVLADVLGFAPTIRKSWNKPNSETLFTWEMCFVRQGLTIFALEKLNFLTALSPISWTIINLSFCIFLIIRRKQVNPALL